MGHPDSASALQRVPTRTLLMLAAVIGAIVLVALWPRLRAPSPELPDARARPVLTPAGTRAAGAGASTPRIRRLPSSRPRRRLVHHRHHRARHRHRQGQRTRRPRLAPVRAITPSPVAPAPPAAPAPEFGL